MSTIFVLVNLLVVSFAIVAPWGAYEFICSLAPLGVIEVEEEQAAATAADKG